MADEVRIQLKVEMDDQFVLDHRSDEELPISALINELTQEIPNIGKPLKENLTSCVFVFYSDKESEKDIEQCVFDILYKLFSVKETEETVKVYVKEIEEEHNDSGQYIEYDDEKGENETKNNGNTEKTKKQIDALIGADCLKGFAQELIDIAPQIKKHDLHMIFHLQTYLFSINDGCGLTTYLQLLSNLMYELGILRTQPEVKEIYVLPGAEGMEKTINDLDFNCFEKNFYCFNITEWMNETDSIFFRKFLFILENKLNEHIYSFRIPFVDKQVLLNVSNNIRDIFHTKLLTFPAFTAEQLREFAIKQLGRNGFSITEDALIVFDKRVIEERRDGRFYGLNTVDKLVGEILYKKLLHNVRYGGHQKKISSDDILDIIQQEIECKSAKEILDSLIGLESVKRKVYEIMAQIELSLKDTNYERPCMHMRFIGNPGTGKTTVARLLGKMLVEKGILKNGNLFEYMGRDFCGRYIGETAPKAASMCRDAYGSILFIDEAYSLYRGNEDSNDFGREALDVLITEMENHKNDFVVIMAGYTHDMETLMKGNTGLESRMPYELDFPNFSRKELTDIFISMMDKKYDYEDSLKEVVAGYFDKLSDETLDSKEFSNARFVRNLYERTVCKAALRWQLDKNAEQKLIPSDFEEASLEREYSLLLQRKKQTIGFAIEQIK